jgi:hypothetical protein
MKMNLRVATAGTNASWIQRLSVEGDWGWWFDAGQVTQLALVSEDEKRGATAVCNSNGTCMRRWRGGAASVLMLARSPSSPMFMKMNLQDSRARNKYVNETEQRERKGTAVRERLGLLVWCGTAMLSPRHQRH